MRVLVVSPSKTIQRTLKEGLGAMVQVVTAASVTAMLDCLRAVAFDMVIYDAGLGPVRESAVRSVQRVERFIVVANRGEEEGLCWSDEVIQKPIDSGVIHESIFKMLEFA